MADPIPRQDLVINISIKLQGKVLSEKEGKFNGISFSYPLMVRSILGQNFSQLLGPAIEESIKYYDGLSKEEKVQIQEYKQPQEAKKPIQPQE